MKRCLVAGLLKRKDGPRSAFAAIKRPLRLLVDDVDDKAPADIAYTFSGYAPLGIRLIEVGQHVNAAYIGHRTGDGKGRKMNHK